MNQTGCRAGTLVLYLYVMSGFLHQVCRYGVDYTVKCTPIGGRAMRNNAICQRIIDLNRKNYL
jgi:hypothetical protein